MRQYVIIAGVPKAGTTSIHHWMSEHPEVCASDEKEANYFLDKDRPWFNFRLNYYSQGLDGYKNCYSECTKKSPKIFFEASPGYHFEQETPLNVIPLIKPCPKIVFVLRKPSARLKSFFIYAQNALLLTNKQWDFEETVKYIFNRSRADMDKEDPFLGMTRAFIETCKYIDYLPRWFDTFGSENVKVMLFENMLKDQVVFMKELSEYAGIESGFWDNYDYPIQNETVIVRSKRIHRMVSEAKKLLKGTLFFAPVRKLYHNINFEKKAEITEKEKEVLRFIDREFVKYNEELADYMKMDLSVWNK